MAGLRRNNLGQGGRPMPISAVYKRSLYTRVSRITDMTAPNNAVGTRTTLTFDSIDGGALVSSGALFYQSGGITIPEESVYHINVSVNWQNTGTGRRGVGITLNGSTLVSEDVQATYLSSPNAMNCNVSLHLLANDIIGADVFQDSGSSILVQGVPSRTFMTVVRIN